MIIKFNFENNTQIPSVKVCIHFFLADPVYSILLYTHYTHHKKYKNRIVPHYKCNKPTGTGDILAT
jgi:hypothetical protein